MSNNVKCQWCSSPRLIPGMLEGVSFVPNATDRKFMSKGVYGITAHACLDCGRIDCIGLDVKVLERLVKK